MSSDYLDRLPPKLREKANHKLGEIELLPPDGTTRFGILYEDEYIVLVRDRVLFPSGQEGSYIRIVNTSDLSGDGGTVMIPIWQDHVTFVRIFRHATRSWGWELPRGYLEIGLTPEENAEKEIREELGVSCHSVRKIGELNPDTGLTANLINVIAVDLANDPTNFGRPQQSEGISHLRSVPRNEIMDFVSQNGVRCGISLAAILLYLNHTRS